MPDDPVNADSAGGDRPPDENDLALRASRGDRRALAGLYDLHVDAIYRYAYFRLRSDAEAEDVTSDVFQRALVAMPRFEPRRPFLAFLYTIARNVVADRFRRTRPEASFDDALDHALPAAALPGIERAIDAQQRIRGNDRRPGSPQAPAASGAPPSPSRPGARPTTSPRTGTR